MTDFNAREMYTIYSCTLKMRDRICGGVPKNPDLIAGWVKATTGHDDKQTVEQTEEAIANLIETTTDKSWCTFQGDENGLFIWARQVKALFKECASMLRITVKKVGSKQIFQHAFEIKSMAEIAVDRIYLGRDSQYIKTPDAFHEGPIHVQTAQGPRTALKRTDYVTEATISFEIWVLRTETAEKRHVGEEEIKRMLTFGQENGLGAERSQGHGKFDVVAFKCVQK